jgi:hypothetical protein
VPSLTIKRCKPLGLWLAALALWVQLLLPAMLCPGVAQPAGDHSLCLAGSHTPGHHDDAPLHKGCPACLSLQTAHGGFVPPVAIAFVHPRDIGAVVDRPTIALALAHWSPPGLQARAPPFPA